MQIDVLFSYLFHFKYYCEDFCEAPSFVFAAEFCYFVFFLTNIYWIPAL